MEICRFRRIKNLIELSTIQQKHGPYPPPFLTTTPLNFFSFDMLSETRSSSSKLKFFSHCALAQKLPF